MGRKFPYLGEHERFQFPSPDQATGEGILGVGGNLSPGMLLSAYSQGVFPWFSPGDPILWWCPDPRFVLFPDKLHISRSMRRVLRRREFSVSFDRMFRRVIEACSATPRPGQRGTWITDEMIESYSKLHELGYAHSVEVSLNGELVGGLYGVSLGSCLFGESMFARVSNASKVGFVYLVQVLKQQGFSLIDSQVHTDHLESLGAEDIPRERYLSLLAAALEAPTRRGNWGELFADDLAGCSVLEGASSDELP
ncbi:leucyl/phenylalanyl-tRNA--protein transferase [Salinispira pacifica]